AAETAATPANPIVSGATNVENADIYGLVDQPPVADVVAPQPKKSRRDDAESRARDDASLDDIYERRRRQAESEKPFVRAKRPDLPERPFWDEIYRPLLSISVLIRIGLTSATAFLPLLFATFYFARLLWNDVAEMTQSTQEMSVLVAFFSCIWRDKLILLLFSFLWGIFSVPYSFHIFTETASGANEIDEWPEYNFIGGLGQFLWIATLICIGGIPGSLLFGAIGWSSVIGFIFSAILLTPIFFLSCMQVDEPFRLITREVAISLKRLFKSWFCFYYISFAFVFGTIGLALLALGIVCHYQGAFAAALTAAAISLIFSFIPALYLRFLGRLAWIIEDDVRKRAIQNEEEEEEFEEEV
ncbi:MAG: hypothetical protein HUK22_05860, partial [Thermoguttaceae bacterium]|nr:hypothetical protein [Thermoguttaceae bacterium]